MEETEEKAIPIEVDSNTLLYHPLAPLNTNSASLLNNQLMPRKHIKLLTYNLFLRPPLIKTNEDDYKNERLALFSDHLKDFDIICIQEVFETLNQRKHDLIRQAAKNGFFFFIESPMTGVFNSFVVDAGILILSRFPIKNWTFFPFPHGVYADGLSHKGFLYAQIEVKEAFIHLVCTHLQADDTHYNICSDIRLEQLKILNGFISNQMRKLYRKGDKVILAGDFNVDGNRYQHALPQGEANKEKYSVEYETMIELLNKNGVIAVDVFLSHDGSRPTTYGSVDENSKPIEVVLTHKSNSNAQMSIDYIFDVSFEEEPSSLFAIDQSSLIVEQFSSSKSPPLTHLSDHYGLSCSIVYNINGINGSNANSIQQKDDEYNQSDVPDDLLSLINY